jgi:hypothetical protein
MLSMFTLLVNVHPKENKILLDFTMGLQGFLFDKFSCEYWVLNLFLVSIRSEYRLPSLPFHNGVSLPEPSHHLNAMTFYV